MFTAEAQARAGAPAYLYRFDWAPPGEHSRLGASHGFDEAFVWNNPVGFLLAADDPGAVGLAEDIAAGDADLNAFVTLDTEGARQAADALDARIARGDDPGPLAGAPVAIKDLLCTSGLRTTFGSAHYSSFVPDEDDVAVARLRAAGAVVVGKNNTSELGYGATPRNALFPTTRNPWNRDLSPTGSSAGSAAAVAASLVPLALGSDGGGSIRVPAAMTGVVGFKPSFGRIPVYNGCRDERMPGVSGWESLEHIGPIARSVADVALAYSVMTGPDARDRHSLPRSPASTRLPQPWRVAYSPDLGFALVDDEVATLCAGAADDLARALRASLRLATPASAHRRSQLRAVLRARQPDRTACDFVARTRHLRRQASRDTACGPAPFGRRNPLCSRIVRGGAAVSAASGQATPIRPTPREDRNRSG